ncbi:MAG: phage late control D family protein [Roseobacter sp.]
MFDLFKPVKRAPGECVISISGTEIADLYPFLMEVTVDTSREAASEAVLKFETRRDVDGSWIVQDDARLRPWKPLKVEAAFGEETEEVMRGYIREIAVDFPEDSGGSVVTVTVQDDSLFLDRTHKRRTWGGDAPTTDGLIATQIISEANLLPDGAPAEGMRDVTATQDETDAVFLKKRAEANGFELIYRAGRIYFGPRRFDSAPQTTIMVYAGPATNCISFSLKDDGHKPDAATYDVAAAEGDSVETRTLKPDLEVLGQEPATSVDTLDDGFVWRISREGESDAANTAVLAQEKTNQNALKVGASGALDGARYGHVLLTGLRVGVDGVGTRHSGTWYVDKVRHVFDLEGYRQEFELLRNAYGDNLQVASNPLAALV